MKVRKIRPVILSGGAGTRLWPTSRARLPKQLLPLISDRSMLQETALRTTPKDGGFLPPYIVCNEEHRFLIAAQLQSIGIAPETILLEPVGRNTAPAATVAALLSRAQDETLLILPADHHIEDVEGFLVAVKAAAEIAENDLMVTFGVVPTHPETGYGYIRAGDPIDARTSHISEFVEKPDKLRATAYVRQGIYLWNSGMFMFKPSVFLREVEQFAPEILAACEKALAEATNETDFVRLGLEALTVCPSEPIDTAIMERSSKGAVMPVDIGWNDVGSWAALWEIGEKDDAGNVTSGDVVTEDSTNCYVRGDRKLISAIGVDNLVVVETDDAILIADRTRAQDVKGIVGRLKASSRSEADHHRKVHRPWGWYDRIEEGPNFQVKVLHVHPRQKLSLQYHNHRTEHWIVVEGTARITIGEGVKTLGPNQSTFVASGERHRLENATDVPLKLIEVQFGDYLGEDDIIRLEDIYERGDPA